MGSRVIERLVLKLVMFYSEVVGRNEGV